MNIYKNQEEVFTKKIRAGKRTYFFDVRSTQNHDYYVTITESKRTSDGNNVEIEKHKIFLYKEDFNKFLLALQETVDYVKKNLLPDFDFDKFTRSETETQRAEEADSWGK